MSTRKVWGWTEQVFDCGAIQAHRIWGQPGGFCSRHFHDHKHNLFIIVSGAMRVEQWNPEGEMTARDLSAGDVLSIAPPVQHRFRVLRPCEAIEVYFATHGDVNPEDITRLDEGGIES